MWNGIPAIRKELAESMMKHHKMSQREVAEKLGVTPAAICQYLSKRRGKIEILDEDIRKEIQKSAENIVHHGDSVVVVETCRICQILRRSSSYTLFIRVTEEEK